MIPEEEYRKAKKEIAFIDRLISEARGEYNQSMKILKKKFRCETIAAAKKLKKKLQRKVKKYEKQFVKEITKFRKTFRKELKQMED